MADELIVKLRGEADIYESYDVITRKLLTEAANSLATAEADIAALREENARLREALTFYAREYSWRSCGMYMNGRPNSSSAEIDGGRKARAALTGARDHD